MINKCRLFIKYLLLALLTSGSCSLFGQVIISGKVMTTQSEVISGANIIAEHPKSRNIIAFTFSDDAGKFELKLDNDIDTIFLVVSHISFNPKELLIATRNKENNIVLVERSETLPEVFVKTEPVVRKGDTLVFDMQRYARDVDENIEDVLRRLPGITIEDNGRIFYRGLAISRFYIEGLDLLEGKYKIATRNLNKNTVLDIEIIEHHQSKKVLKDLVRPNEAAINLKLKSNIAITGAIEAGGGISKESLTHLIGADIFGFKKKFQFHTHVSSNDFGRNQSNQYENLYESDTEIDGQLISVNQLFPPFTLNQNVYINNKERIAGFDVLKKTSSTSQIKWHLRYITDELSTAGNELLIFSEDSISQFTNFQTTEHPSSLENTVIFELNRDALYINANNKVNVEWTTINGNHLFNQQSSPEQLINNAITAASNVEFTFRKGDKAQTIYTDISFKTNSDSLEVAQTNLIIPDPFLVLSGDFLQVVGTKKFEADTYTSFLFKKGQYTRNITMGTRYSSQNLQSNLLTSNFLEPASLTTNTFDNDYTLKEWKPYLNQSHRIESKNASWNLNIPIQWYHFDLNDTIRNINRTENFLLFDVALDYRRLTDKQYGLNINYTYSHNYDSFNNYFYEGYILTSNRNLSRLNQQINRYKRHSASFFIDKNNVLGGSYYKLGATYHRSKYDLIDDTNFSSQGTTSNLGFRENIRHRSSIDFLLSGQLTKKIDFSVDTDFSYNNRPFQINGEFSRVNYFSLFTKLKLSHVLGKRIISLSTSFLKQSSNLFPSASDQLTMRLVYFLKHNFLGTIKLSYEPYLIIAENINQWNHLLRLELKRKIERKNIELTLQLLNLTNASFFNNFEQNAYSSKFSSVNLRPLQIQLSAIKKF